MNTDEVKRLERKINVATALSAASAIILVAFTVAAIVIASRSSHALKSIKAGIADYDKLRTALAVDK